MVCAASDEYADYYLNLNGVISPEVDEAFVAHLRSNACEKIAVVYYIRGSEMVARQWDIAASNPLSADSNPLSADSNPLSADSGGRALSRSLLAAKVRAILAELKPYHPSLNFRMIGGQWRFVCTSSAILQKLIPKLQLLTQLLTDE